MKSFKELDIKTRRDLYQKEAKKIINEKKVAIIVELHPKSKLCIKKYINLMVSSNFTVLALQESIKKKLQSGEETHTFNATQSIFLFCKKNVLQSSTKIGDLIKQRDPEDNFIYLQIAEVESF